MFALQFMKVANQWQQGLCKVHLLCPTVTITCFLRMKVWYFPSGFLCLLGNHQLGTMALLIACRVCCDAVAGTERQVYHVFLHAKP